MSESCTLLPRANAAACPQLAKADLASSSQHEREGGSAPIAGRETMATYILLASFTDQGIRKIKDSPKRADAFKDMAKKCGATVKDVFWTLGEYDIVAVVEAPDDISITALGLSSG